MQSEKERNQRDEINMQTTNFTIPERITVNGKTFHFDEMVTITRVNEYLDMIEKLQAYDSHVVFGKRQ